jgi:hypothetical protein
MQLNYETTGKGFIIQPYKRISVITAGMKQTGVEKVVPAFLKHGCRINERHHLPLTERDFTVCNDRFGFFQSPKYNVFYLQKILGIKRLNRKPKQCWKEKRRLWLKAMKFAL